MSFATKFGQRQHVLFQKSTQDEIVEGIIIGIRWYQGCDYRPNAARVEYLVIPLEDLEMETDNELWISEANSESFPLILGPYGQTKSPCPYCKR